MVKIAVIGAGFMGRTHAEAYSRIELAQVAAVCDRDKAREKSLPRILDATFTKILTPWLQNVSLRWQISVCLRFFMKRLQSGQQNMENIFSVRNRQP